MDGGGVQTKGTFLETGAKNFVNLGQLGCPKASHPPSAFYLDKTVLVKSFLRRHGRTLCGLRVFVTGPILGSLYWLYKIMGFIITFLYMYITYFDLIHPIIIYGPFCPPLPLPNCEFHFYFVLFFIYISYMRKNIILVFLSMARFS